MISGGCAGVDRSFAVPVAVSRWWGLDSGPKTWWPRRGADRQSNAAVASDPTRRLWPGRPGAGPMAC